MAGAFPLMDGKWMWRRTIPLGIDNLQRAAPWAVVGLILLLAHALAELTWRLVPDPADSHAPVLAMSAPLSGQQAESAARASLDRVASLHLLGRAEAEPAPETPAAAPLQAPETRLNLTLKGIFTESAQQFAFALIAQGNAGEQVYRVGDDLPGGARLHEVDTHRVILSRGGRFETLTLPRERMDTESAPVDRRTPATVNTSTQQLRELRATLIENPQEALRLVSIQPVMEGGAIRGYSVRPGQDPRLFNETGLRAGDVVTAVNGIPMNDQAQLGALFQQLGTASTLNITVERRGRQTELTLNLE